MAITVKQIVAELIESFPDKSEIDVDYIEKFKENEIDRVDIVKALQDMEQEGLGVFMKGRRGKLSRFVKGMTRAKNVVNKESLEALRTSISSLNQGDVMLVSLEDCSNKASDEQIVELDTFRDKTDAASFFNNNTARAVDALKLLQGEGLGSFVIGRRGKFSRFIKGVSKDELQNRPKGLIPSEEKEKVSIIEVRTPKYNVVRNIILRTFEDGEFDNVEDAMVKAEAADVVAEVVKESLCNLGYFVA